MPGGSEDDSEIHVIETASGRETGDVILRARDIVSPAAEGGVHWLPDGHSFVYGRLQNLPKGAPATELYQKYRAYLHVLGTDPERDRVVFGYGVTHSIEVDPRDLAVFRMRPSWGYALGVLNHLTPNSAFYIAPAGAIGNSDSAWHKVADFSDQVRDVVVHGDYLYLLTFKDAPRYKIVRTDARNPTLASAETIVIACAQYLVDKQYTSPARLAGVSGSAGGITIGRAITERPDLFGSAIIVVGCLDMLRQETTANGVPNIPEFGSTKTKPGFDALYAMSAYAHVKDHTPYPAVLLLTGINDPRVDPWQPAKMAARLQAATSSGKPVLLRVDYGGGHCGGSGEEQFQEQMADLISFDLWQLGVPAFQPPKP
jgi:protease II